MLISNGLRKVHLYVINLNLTEKDSSGALVSTERAVLRRAGAGGVQWDIADCKVRTHKMKLGKD